MIVHDGPVCFLFSTDIGHSPDPGRRVNTLQSVSSVRSAMGSSLAGTGEGGTGPDPGSSIIKPSGTRCYIAKAR